ncbi:MAG: hypothetical protein ACYC27_07390 [Armatimonadota bacterium]
MKKLLMVMLIVLVSGVVYAKGKGATPVNDAKGAPKFCNLIFADTDKDIIGMERFIAAAKERGLYDKIKFTVMFHSDRVDLNISGQRETYQQLYKDGHEIGVWYAGMRPKVAEWLGIPESKITTSGFQLFGDPDMDEQARETEAGFRASANVCIEGDSFKDEFWDVPHNWEGAPWFPYWTQWDSAKPTSTARVNRELDKSNAMLELQWATRTMWETYDRICLPQNFHFGEPLKKEQWPFSPLVKRGDISWWRDEIDQYEKNLQAGRTPFLYINTGSESNIFTPNGAWKSFLDSDEALECALDFIQMMLDKKWQLITVSDFVDYYQSKWPCPEAPSSVFLLDDTLAGHKDRSGLTVPSHGRLLRAETKHFQITDQENRMAPEMVVAYDLRTPNLLRGGYTFGDPNVWAVGANKAQYASTTGNAVFWSMTQPLVNSKGEQYYHINKPEDSKNRTFTFYLGDDWEPYQFTKAEFKDVKRDGEKILWSKVMKSSMPGTDIRIRYDTILDKSKQTIRVTVLGDDAEGLPARFRLCPYFHQGWDNDYVKAGDKRPSTIPDPLKVGQERNVFARVNSTEFAYSESNIVPMRKRIQLEPGPASVDIFNRNPGRDHSDPLWTIDDNPDMNRGLTLSFDGEGSSVEFVDPSGPWHFVTAVVDMGRHVKGRVYEFTFQYWHGEPK